MREIHVPISEADRLLESILISPDALITDNGRNRAIRRTNGWNKARQNFDQTEVWCCGDARVDEGDEDIIIKSIVFPCLGAATDLEPYKAAINNPRVNNFIIMSHHDQETVIEGETPLGCGARHVKAEQIKNKNGTEMSKKNGAQKHADLYMGHPDPIIQACITAENVAGIVRGKPILVVTQDHLTGRIYPVAVYTSNNNVITRRAPQAISKYLFDQNYDAKAIYKNGIPTLTREELPNVFKDFMEQNDKRVEMLQKAYPDFSKTQKVQNPNTVVLSTHLRPLRTRYAYLFEKPGSAFKLAVPRGKDGAKLLLKKIDDVLNQLEYPISYAVENYNKPDQPFANTRRIFIDTEDFEASKYLAKKMVEMPWIQEWLNLPDHDHKIIIGECKRGKATRIEWFENS